MSNSWRDFADQMTDRTRALFETAELRGTDPDELRRDAGAIVDGERFQLACDSAAVPPRIGGTSPTGWMLPDERYPETYREVTVQAATCGPVTIDTVTEVNLDGQVLGSHAYVTTRSTDTTLTAAEARQIAENLRQAADLLDSL